MRVSGQPDPLKRSPGDPVLIRVPLTSEQTMMVASLTGKLVTELKLTREQLKSLVGVGSWAEAAVGS
jgi:hypothetical protein